MMARNRESRQHERGSTDNGEFPNPSHYSWCVNCHRTWHWWLFFTACDWLVSAKEEEEE